MANRTVKDANSIHGTNPQYLIEKIIRTRIYDSKYWKEECFALTAELVVDKAMALRYIGGVHGGNIKPSPFLCLTLKMLQIQPEKDIIVEFIKQDEFKYLRALGSFYLRLVYPSLDCYKYLEPLLNDYRKLRLMDRNGVFHLTHMDVFIDNILREDRYVDVIMPRIQKRWVHETNGELEARVSLLDDDFDDLESESDDDEEVEHSPPRSSPKHRSERRGYSPHGRDKRRRSISPSANHKRRRESGRESRRHRESGRDRDRRDRDYHGSSMDGYGEHRRYHQSDHRSSDYSSYSSSRDHHREDHRSRGEDRDHHRHHRSDRDEGRSRRDKKDSSRSSKREHKSDRKKSDGGDLQAEIDEANKLRAQLGLPPLRP